MSDLGADYTALDHARDHAASVATELRDQHRHLHEAVTLLLDSDWTGAAAGQFHEAFAEWSHGAATVLEGLNAMSVLLDGTRQTLQDQDAAVGANMTRLHGRLD